MKKIVVSITNIASTKAEPDIEIKNNMIAPTLLARDWKGWSNYSNAAVLEIKKDDEQ